MYSALVAGATGLIGKELVELILEDPQYQRVVLLVRRPLEIENRKLHQVVTDFDRLDDVASWFMGTDRVFCCLGTTMKTAKSREAFQRVDYTYPMQLARLAEAKGVSQFLCVSAMGASPESSVFYSRVKGELERDISSMHIPSITFFRPSLLLGDRTENRPGERAAIFFAKAFSFLFVGKLKNYKGIHVKKVAQAMLSAANENRKGVRVVMSGEMQ